MINNQDFSKFKAGCPTIFEKNFYGKPYLFMLYPFVPFDYKKGMKKLGFFDISVYASNIG